MLTRGQIKSIFPKASDADIDAFLKFGEEALKQSGILDMVTRLQYFLAQLGHESNGLTHREENLNYSAERLTEVFESRFPTMESAMPYARNPEKLANFVYGGRLGNLNPGDGYRYRGRGYIQLTGRETYREVGRIAGLDLETNPDLASKPEHAVKIACAFWTWKNINPACDVADFTAVTRKINGGTNGLNDRLQWLSKVKSIVATKPAASTTSTSSSTSASTSTSTSTSSHTTSHTTTTPASHTSSSTATTPAKPKPEKPATAESPANPAVMEAQKKLSRLGYYKGVFNGIYDQVLRTALWAFQKDEDLPQTGRLDARTREELNV